MAKKKAAKYSFINEVFEGLSKCAEVSRKGEVKIKRSDLKACLESAFTSGAKAAAGGERTLTFDRDAARLSGMALL